MHIPSVLLAAAAAAPLVAALPGRPEPCASDVNPFLGKQYFVNPVYSDKLDQTYKAFKKQKDHLNAARVRTIQEKIGTFVWVSAKKDLPLIDMAIKEARKLQKKGKKQIVGLVLYDLPDRDCSANSSNGEFTLANDGLSKYKKEFVDVYAKKIASAPDITFAIVLEPDSLGNLVTNLETVPKCAGAASAYKEGIAYAISKLQFSNVALYIDAAHGGWLGWDGNLAPTAALFAEVVKMAGKNAKIRGFATDVSNYNPYIANPRANYTQYSNAYDESSYASVLAPHLRNNSLPAHFIIDQGRSGLQNVRQEWGEWCNIRSGFGLRPTTNTGNPVVDSIVWVKPGGESDGSSDPNDPKFDEMCRGPSAVLGAPSAGDWFEAFAEMLVKNANPPLEPTY